MNPPSLVCLAMTVALVSGAATAATPDARTIAREGNGHGAAACSSCHGVHGEGQAAAGFPRLAGVNASYLLRQLDAYGEGTRKSPVMKPVATALTEDERRAMAGYYSQLPVPASPAAPAAASSSGDGRGKRLAIRGRWSQQVPGCVQCHGPHGVGVGEHFPPLSGQPAKYIADQLHAWQDGSRRNDPLDLMKHVALALDDEDIQAVSAWFATQPTTARGDKP